MAFSPRTDVLRALTRYSASGVAGMMASLPGGRGPRQTRVCYHSDMKTGLVVLIALAVVLVGLFAWGISVNNQGLIRGEHTLQ